ncbi:hypothetical protein E1287_09050 [Actinomadura sp. KC06]|uniref:hypothetical protein n=1 Tax=Actinomadura sp. KC06 TaxID=2530369 RepID=UPI00104650DC|nr:hypothetical protein [Actinomadura sp. KC06]TDD37294.1 hypothetical protein E1287_09050 [Actinomadura sp. KC06]
MRTAICLTGTAVLLGVMAGPVSAAPTSETADAAAPAFTSKSWKCSKPAGKKFKIKNDSPNERWTRLSYNNPCSHKWYVRVYYKNSGGAVFSYPFTVKKNSKGSKSLKPRPGWIIKVEASKKRPQAPALNAD